MNQAISLSSNPGRIPLWRGAKLKASLALCAFLAAVPLTKAGDHHEKVKALLITGGCCHNYPFQSKALTEAISKKASVQWTIVHEGGTGTHAEIDLYQDSNWAKKFDIVIHNECFADTKEPSYIRKITQAHHEGVPALVIHCAMHTYRSAQIQDWRQFLGVTSRRHDHQSNYPVKIVAPDHPIMKGFPTDWVTAKDELYIVDQIGTSTQVLATSQSERDKKSHAVVWVNTYGKARVFGTTYGHSDDTFRDPVFLDLLGRGFLWALGKN